MADFNEVFYFNLAVSQLSPESYFHWLTMFLQRDGPNLGLFLSNLNVFDCFILKNEINKKLPILKWGSNDWMEWIYAFNLCYSCSAICNFYPNYLPLDCYNVPQKWCHGFPCVLEEDVGMIKRVAFSILSSGTSKVVALMILECPDKTTLFAFTRKFLSWRVLPSLILLNWLSSRIVAIITLVKSAMLKFSMLPGTPLLPVNLAVWPTFATLTVNFRFA